MHALILIIIKINCMRKTPLYFIYELKWTKKWLNSKVARSHIYKRHLTQQVYTSTIKVWYSIHIYNESSGHQATITPRYNYRHHWICSLMSLFYLCMWSAFAEINYIYLKHMVYIQDKGIYACIIEFG